jgi:peptidoglycan/LPS O-acetylase OafA/YrhL
MDANRAATPGRLEGLDVLRGLAAVSVMEYHYTTWYSQDMGGHPPPGVFFDLPWGHHGVDLFFIISGFVIFMTLERTRSLGDFLFSRFARLWPAFVASLVVTVLVCAVLEDSAPPQDAWTLLINLTMTPDLWGARTFDGSYWSLLYELSFYALSGAVWFLVRPRAPEPACAAWLLASLALRWNSDWVSAPVIQLTATWYCQLFAIGIMLFRIRAGRATLLTWVVLILALTIAAIGPHAVLDPLPGRIYVVLIAAFAYLVWFAAAPRAGARFPRPLLFLGRISYPLYLVHQEMGLTAIARLEALGFAPDAAVLAATAQSLLVAWAISVSVEYPAQAWLRARYRAWRDGATRLAPAVA